MKNNLSLVSKLLRDFDNFVGNRSTACLIWPEGVKGIIGIILEWDFEVWAKEYEYLDKEDKLMEWGVYSNISRILDSIFRQIALRALKDRGSSSFFRSFTAHAEKYKEESISGHYYIDTLFITFHIVFFENIETSPDRFAIWDYYFPKEWKVTTGNFKKKENIISRVLLRYFLDWAERRIWQAKEEFDKELNDVSSNLFPETDPILWARLLIFLFSPYGEDRMKSVIERPWNFGFIGRITIARFQEGFEMISEQKRLETMNTFELAYLLFRKEFSKDNLEKYIESLKNLKYQQESDREKKRLELLEIFTEMLKFVIKEESRDST
jgi:hypothetical protein